MDNYWDELEYSKYKLLLHPEKTEHIFRVLRGQTAADPLFPVSAELHLTNRCNLCCEWCTDSSLHTACEEMSTDTVCRLIAELAAHSTGITVEGGGEPTLHPDFSRIVRHGVQCGARLGLITNGTKDISDVLSCFRWVRVSLDASTPEEYRTEKGADCFETVLENLARYAALRDPARTQLGVGFVLTKRNHSRLIPLMHRLDAIGVDYLYIRPVEESPLLKPDAETLCRMEKELKAAAAGLRIRYRIRIAERFVCNNDGLPCIAHSLTSIIHANGDVVMCEKRRHDMRIFGNAARQCFAEIWASESRKDASRCALNPDMQKGCRECRITAYNRLFWKLAHIHSADFI